MMKAIHFLEPPTLYATYVGDIVTSDDTVEAVLHLQDRLGRGRFERRKSALSPFEETFHVAFLKYCHKPQSSVLGIHWSAQEDHFYEFKYSQGIPMKRKILSVTAKLYDPCGFIAPLITLAKRYIRSELA